jgi:hypothetical protein
MYLAEDSGLPELSIYEYQQLGFRFDPFQHLDAAKDHHLGEYIVGHEAAAIAWHYTPAFVYAPAGGGKTTLRVYTTQTCWNALGLFHPFPIFYRPQFFAADELPFPAERYLTEILQAAATDLLLALAYHPAQFLQLEPMAQRSLRSLFEFYLPAPLSRYLAILGESASPVVLRSVLDRLDFGLPDLPPAELLQTMVQQLQRLSPDERWQRQLPAQQFAGITSLLLSALGFSAIYLLVDGIDAFPSTYDASDLAARWMADLLTLAEGWPDSRIFIKGFLPQELEPLLESKPARGVRACSVAHLRWPADLLAEVVRRRVYAASGGQFGSLDALAEPGLRDLETRLARSVYPLPRELILLVQRMLACYLQRLQGRSGDLREEDLHSALQWYERHKVNV